LVHFDPTISLGSVLVVVTMTFGAVWWGGVISSTIKRIEEKMDDLVTRREFDISRDGQQKQINGINTRMDLDPDRYK